MAGEGSGVEENAGKNETGTREGKYPFLVL